MKSLIVIVLVFAAYNSQLYSSINSLEMINDINSKTDLWVAGENQFTGMDIEEFKNTRLGLNMEKSVDFMPREPVYTDEEMERTSTLPSSFDSREQWSNCIHPIRDQESCGSCWAFSASEVLSDRGCIESKGAENDVLSPQEMVSCSDMNMGCSGGNLGTTWNFMCKYGLVKDSCKPYTSGKGDSGTCNWEKCTDGETWAARVYAEPHSSFNTVEKIQRELMLNGPIQTGFIVYEDFMSYKSGIYEYTTGGELGGHAVKIVGWGTSDEGQGYWIVANSWNTTWGLDGFFWVKWNDSALEFESQGVASKVSLTPLSFFQNWQCYL